MNNVKYGIAALDALRSKLDATSHLEVIHEGGYCWSAFFRFQEPATKEELELVKMHMNISLPPAYEQFLMYCNGARLYQDEVYGQWGFHFYSTGELLSKNIERKKPYGDRWSASYLIFAESLGDADLLVLDTSQYTRDRKDCGVVDGDSGYGPAEWRTIARGFSDWLDRLVVAQGAKYWRWY
ncbi:MAG: SMI1/KNR4 family protein [Ktedonobacteraceae bacterium]